MHLLLLTLIIALAPVAVMSTQATAKKSPQTVVVKTEKPHELLPICIPCRLPD